MKIIIAILALVSAVSLMSPATADDEFYTRAIVVPTPEASEYRVYRDLVYRQTGEGRTRADIYVPVAADQKHAAVVFVHGGPIPANLPAAKDWQFFQSYGSLVTGAGLAGVVFNHRFESLNDLQTAAGDIRAAVDFVRKNAEKYSIDADNICLWFYSGSGSFVAPFLSQQPGWLKCIVIYYAVLGPRILDRLGDEVTDIQRAGLDPFPALAPKSNWDPAFFIAEAGKDNNELNTGLRLFSDTAIKNGWKVEYWNHPTGPHGFDLDQNDQRSRLIIHRTVRFLTEQLQANHAVDR